MLIFLNGGLRNKPERNLGRAWGSGAYSIPVHICNPRWWSTFYLLTLSWVCFTNLVNARSAFLRCSCFNLVKYTSKYQA
jgi:hypothetical protein